MKLITSNEELNLLIAEGSGYSAFLGSISSQNGRDIIDCPLGCILFEKEEIGSDFYNQCIDSQQN